MDIISYIVFGVIIGILITIYILKLFNIEPDKKNTESKK